MDDGHISTRDCGTEEQSTETAFSQLVSEPVLLNAPRQVAVKETGLRQQTAPTRSSVAVQKTRKCSPSEKPHKTDF